jgi:hypothetical protein
VGGWGVSVSARTSQHTRMGTWPSVLAPNPISPAPLLVFLTELSPSPSIATTQSELPLVLPKGLTSGVEGSKRGPKSLLVELDERDRGQDLTGACVSLLLLLLFLLLLFLLLLLLLRRRRRRRLCVFITHRLPPSLPPSPHHHHYRKKRNQTTTATATNRG